MLDPVAAAIPVFFALIGLEVVVARGMNRRVYRFNDAITDLGCGVTDQVGGVFLGIVGVTAYIAAYDHARLLTLPDGGLGTWLLAILGVDLGYYLWHRASHRVNFIWATHVVHHQSDEYNLAVALRQAVFAGLTSWPFYLWLAILGVSPLVFAVAKSFNLLYQFWIHTRVVGKLGPLEWILNTPSHHRVHHGTNLKYIDKNYAGVLIIWDRMFGTFQVEEEEPTYGTVSEYASWNPVWAQFAYWVHLWDVAKRAQQPLDKLKIWFMPPEWTPAGLPPHVFPPDHVLASRPRYQADSPALHGYIALQWVPVALVTTGMLLAQHDAPWALLAPLGAWVLVSLIAFGGLFEAKPWARWLEIVRLMAFGALGGVAAVSIGGPTLAVVPMLIAFASLAWLTLRRQTPHVTAPYSP
jgi:alkylglycerol monooxygenase